MMAVKDVFNRSVKDMAWDAFEDIGIVDFREAVYAARADLAGKSFAMPPQGQNGLVMFMGNEVFKCPTASWEGSLSYLLREISILKVIAQHNIPFYPRLTFESANGAFYGMTRTAGSPVREVYEAASPAQRRKLEDSIIDMQLRIDAAVHSAQTKVSLPSMNKSWELMLGKHMAVTEVWHRDKDVRRVLTLLSPETRQILDDYAGRYIRRQDVLIHGDLNGGNMMADWKTYTVTGLIDVSQSFVSKAVEANFEDMRPGCWYPCEKRAALFNAYAARSNDPMVKEGDYVLYEAVKVIEQAGRFKSAPDAAKEIEGIFTDARQGVLNRW